MSAPPDPHLSPHVSSNIPTIPTVNSAVSPLSLVLNVQSPVVLPLPPSKVDHAPVSTPSISPHLDPPDPQPSAYKPPIALADSPLPSVFGERKWSSLFKRKPRNAGKFIPVDLSPIYEDEALVPPVEVIAAGAAIWKETLVGFFLDKPLSYTAVVQKLKYIWKLKGDVSVKSDGIIFLFNFSCCEDRRSILQSDPIIMNNKLFIIKPYDAAVSNVTGSVTSVPVWVHLYNLPLFAWSPLGINWLSSHLGKLLCMDEMTEKQERLSYAKCLIEVRPEKELVEEFLVKLVEGGYQKIYVEYLWKPDVCVLCKNFGHKTEKCDIKDNCDAKDVKEQKTNGVVEDKVGYAGRYRVHNIVVSNNKQTNSKWQRVQGKRKVVTKEANLDQIEEKECEGNKEETSVVINTKEKDWENVQVEKENVQCSTDDRGGIQRSETIAVNYQENANIINVEKLKTPEMNKEGDDFIDSIQQHNRFEVLNELEAEDITVKMCESQQSVNEKSKSLNEHNEDEGRNENVQRDAQKKTSIKNPKGKEEHLVQIFDEVNTLEVNTSSDTESKDNGTRCEGRGIQGNNSSDKKNKKKKQMNAFHRKENEMCQDLHMHDHSCKLGSLIIPKQANGERNVPPLLNVYSKIKPPNAFKPPPMPIMSPTSLTSSPSSPINPNQVNPPTKEGTSNCETTPLSVVIPNYLNSSQAVTRRMKIEIINASVHQ
jgi:hypothetical protein